MKKVLLIEDNVEMRENTSEILELANYNVITAPNGKEGVKMAQENLPDLIICDIMMPELDGYGVLHLLSKDEKTSNIPFIFLTAKAEKSDVRKGMNLGADDYLTKPYDDTELLNAVETRLKKGERLRAEFEKSITGLDSFLSEAGTIASLDALVANRKLKKVKKKELVFSEDSNPNFLYFVSTGKIKVFKTNEFGKEFITDLYNTGEFFGYDSLLMDTKYSASASAIEDSEVCAIPKDDFFKLMYKNKDVASRFITLLSNDIKEKEERLIKLAYNSVRKRVAEGLLLLNDRYNSEHKPEFTISISREDLANIVGTASETVIRTLSDFKEEHLIDIKGSNITILGLDKLKKIKN